MAREKSEAELRDSVHRYGKQVFSEKEQIRILYLILEDAMRISLQSDHRFHFKMITHFTPI
ncbi:hypothetical protein ELY15_15335 [Legionella sp. km772]|nr:hypothetical protein ELY15_15335 [Legionella sp. km772]